MKTTPSSSLRKAFVVAALFIAVNACRPMAMPTESMWDGTVELGDGVSVPLRMSLGFSGANPTGYFLVGDERTPIPEISRTKDSVTLRFSEYGAEVRATWDGRRLSGNYDRIRTSGTKSFPFTAAPAESSSTESSSATSDVRLPQGDYRVLFDGQKSTNGETTAKFWLKGPAVYGTFIAPDGDYGLLAGGAVPNGIQLSRFTGWQAIAIVLEPHGGAWKGRFHAASNPRPLPFTLEPIADSAQAFSAKRAVMKDPNAAFAFSGISLEGKTVRHTDESFKGKSLIVDIMGTWCHNCLDEAPVLQKLQDRFGKDGLEIIGLSFEISEDPALAKKNLQLYKDRFGLTYTLLFCGSLDDENLKTQIHSQLDNFFAYPTTLFIDRNHRVQAIHSGFRGPGTGDEFQSQVREFEELVSKLVDGSLPR